MNTWTVRACVTAGAVAAVGLLAAGTASAHVTANSPDAMQGGYAVITFRVPTESATATTVTWTAQPGTSIGADQFGQFQISVWPLPKAARLSLPAEQTYSDGAVVKWDEPPKADGSEPDHPVPTMELAAAGASADPVSAANSVDTAHTPGTAGTDSTARWLGGIGLLLGALGLGVAGGTALRSRRNA